jgi:hypothetical protein
MRHFDPVLIKEWKTLVMELYVELQRIITNHISSTWGDCCDIGWQNTPTPLLESWKWYYRQYSDRTRARRSPPWST